MLKKRYRLKNKKAFDATYNLKQVVSNSLLILYIGKKKTKNELDTKFGFIASKKYHKRAVKRNRIKRLVRESVRLILKNNEFCELNNYLSFIFVPKNDALDTNFYDIDNAVKDLFLRGLNKF